MIVSSTITEDAVQIDGRRFITEQHTDESGEVFTVTYLAEEKDEPKDMLEIRAKQIDAIRVEQAERVEAERIAEKERATVLLTLKDSDLKSVLKLPTLDEVAKTKEDLAKIAEAESKSNVHQRTS